MHVGASRDLLPNATHCSSCNCLSTLARVLFASGTLTSEDSDCALVTSSWVEATSGLISACCRVSEAESTPMCKGAAAPGVRPAMAEAL